jgi:hypothetical protein
MAITGFIFPDVNEFHPVTDFAKASKAGVVGYRIRDDSADRLDEKAAFHYNGFKGRGLVELLYTVENVAITGAQAYQRLKTAFPWRPGIIYVADVEKGGRTQDQARAFVNAAQADGKPGCVYGLASSMFADADIKWVARYGLPQPTGAHIWQFNGGAEVPGGLEPETFPGVKGNCDMNKLIMPFDRLKKLSGLEEEMSVEALEKELGITAGTLRPAILSAISLKEVAVDNRKDRPNNAIKAKVFDLLKKIGVNNRG